MPTYAGAIHEFLLPVQPILMTTLAAMLGALPLVIAIGPGSELRRPLVITIIGGLLVSQVLTLDIRRRLFTCCGTGSVLDGLPLTKMTVLQQRKRDAHAVAGILNRA